MVDREFLRGFTKLYALWRGSKKDAYGMAILKEALHGCRRPAAGPAQGMSRPLLKFGGGSVEILHDVGD